MNSLKQLLVYFLIFIMTTNSFAQENKNKTFKNPKDLTLSMNQNVEKLYKNSLSKLNSALESDNQVQLKEIILKGLANDEDKKYVNHLFSTFKPQAFKGIKIKYNEGFLLLKAKDGKILKIKSTTDNFTKININDASYNLSSFLTIKEVVEELVRIVSASQSNKTVFNHFQSIFLGEAAYATDVVDAMTTAIAIVLSVISDNIADNSNDFSACLWGAEYAYAQMIDWRDACSYSLNKKKWDDNKTLNFLSENKTDLSKNVNLICSAEADRLGATMRTKKTLFILKKHCFFSDERRDGFCGLVKELQQCITDTKEYWRNPTAIIDDPRNAKKVKERQIVWPEKPVSAGTQK